MSNSLLLLSATHLPASSATCYSNSLLWNLPWTLFGFASSLARSLVFDSLCSEQQLDAGHGKKAILITVPPPLLKSFHKIQPRLVRELEKKFSDRHVLFAASRRIMGKPSKGSRQKQQRPRSRTLTSVHEKLLEDLVYPTEIVGKRTKVRVDGSKVTKVWVPRGRAGRGHGTERQTALSVSPPSFPPFLVRSLS